MGLRDRNHCQKRSARSTTDPIATSVTKSLRSVLRAVELSAEEGQLLRLAFDLRVEPEHRPEKIEVSLFAREQPAQMIRLEDMPVLFVERLREKRRARQLETDELAS